MKLTHLRGSETQQALCGYWPSWFAIHWPWIRKRPFCALCIGQIRIQGARDATHNVTGSSAGLR